MSVRAFGLTCAAIALAAATSASAATSPAAKHFLTTAMQGDNSEMMLGQLAAKKGGTDQVKSFGQTLHDDHAQGKSQVQQVAKQMGVPDTDAVPTAAKAEQAKLDKLNGAAFDKEFARYMVQDHKKDIALFQAEAKKGGPTGQLAEQTLPVLQKHLQMAEQLSK